MLYHRNEQLKVRIIWIQIKIYLTQIYIESIIIEVTWAEGGKEGEAARKEWLW